MGAYIRPFFCSAGVYRHRLSSVVIYLTFFSMYSQVTAIVEKTDKTSAIMLSTKDACFI